MDLQSTARLAVRRAARHTPSIYNWRNRHNVLIQRLRGGVHDSDFELLRRLDVESPVVVDVGANTGQTLQTIKTIRPAAHVICIEPSALVLAPLVRLASRFPDVEVAPFAVGAKFGSARISTPLARGIYFTQYATLTTPDAAAVAAQLNRADFGPLDPTDVTFHRARCVIAPLDAVVEVCDVLKVDAEGYEDDVFRGAERLLASSLPVIVAERPSAALDQHLKTVLGYALIPTEGSVNAVYAHPDRSRGLT